MREHLTDAGTSMPGAAPESEQAVGGRLEEARVQVGERGDEGGRQGGLYRGLTGLVLPVLLMMDADQRDPAGAAAHGTGGLQGVRQRRQQVYRPRRVQVRRQPHPTECGPGSSSSRRVTERVSVCVCVLLLSGRR